MAAKNLKPITYNRFKGIRNDISAESMANEDLVMAINCDLSNDGQMSRRDGFTQLQALTSPHSLFVSRNESVALFVSGSSLYRLSADLTSSTAISSGLTPGLTMSYAEYGDRIYHGNGEQVGVFEDNVVRLWGLAVPDKPALSSTGGAMTAGLYAVVVTAVTQDGHESGATDAATITIEAGGISVSVPALDSRAVGFNVYCTAPNGEELFHAGYATGGSFTLDVDPKSLGRPLMTQYMTYPGPATHLAHYKGRILMAQGPVLTYTDAYSPELIDVRRRIEFPANITMLAPGETGVFVATDNKETHWLSGNDPDQFVQRKVHLAHAIKGSLTYAPMGEIAGLQGERDIPIWLSSEGVIAGTPDGELVNLSRKWNMAAPVKAAAITRQVGANHQYLCSLIGV